MLGQGSSYGLRILYFIVIARLLGVVQYGIVVGAFGLVNLVAQYSRMGTGTVLVRYVAPDSSRCRAYWGNALLVTLFMGCVIVLILIVLAPHVIDPASAAIVGLTAAGSCICEQVAISAVQVFQSLQIMRTAAWISQLTSLARAAAAFSLLVTIRHATAVEWSVASLVASCLAAIIAITVVTVQRGWPHRVPGLMWSHAWEGLGYAFASSTVNAYDDLDKTMLSHYGMNEANGNYGLAYRVIDMGTMPLMAILLAAEPRLFQLAAEGADGAIQLGRRLLKHSLLVSAAASFGMFVLAPLIPELVGKGFRDAASALRWLCLIPIFRSVHWTTGSVLTSIGLQRYRTCTQMIVVALNFCLNIWLIPTYGWRGAAWASLATDGTLALLNFGVVEFVRRTKTQPSLETVCL